MGCRNDYMTPTGKEKQTKHVATLYVYLADHLDEEAPDHITEAASHIYGGTEECMVSLCSRLTRLQKEDPDLLDSIVYNAHDRTARRLADWWEDHQEEDKKREEKEKE